MNFKRLSAVKGRNENSWFDLKNTNKRWPRLFRKDSIVQMDMGCEWRRWAGPSLGVPYCSRAKYCRWWRRICRLVSTEMPSSVRTIDFPIDGGCIRAVAGLWVCVCGVGSCRARTCRSRLHPASSKIPGQEGKTNPKFTQSISFHNSGLIQKIKPFLDTGHVDGNIYEKRIANERRNCTQVGKIPCQVGSSREAP